MSISLLTRFISLSITPRTSMISTLHFSTSLADTLFTHLQKYPTNIERTLNLIKPKLDAKCVCEVLNRCSFDNSQMGLRFFIWAGYQSNYRHSSFSYGKACELFKIKQNPHVVFDLFEVYRAEKCMVSAKTFKVVLNLCKEGKLANEALLVLRKMEEFDIFADTNAYNVVIRLFCDKGDLDMAQNLIYEMSLNDLYPDMVTYALMIKGFCDVGRLEDGCRLFKEMKGHGCVPNVVTYSTLLDGICKFGTVERALELLAEMEKEGGDCSPNILTYTSVIQGLCEKGRTMDAFSVLDRMEACGCAPNRVTASTLLNRLCMDGHIEEAYKLIDRLVLGGSVSYGDCYSSIVLSLIRNKNVEVAEKLFQRALSSGVKPDSLACSLMIKELCSEKRMLDGYWLYDEMEKLGFLSTIDSDIYPVLLVGLCQQGHSIEAAKLTKSMLVKGISLGQPYLDKVVDHLKKFGGAVLVPELACIRRKC